MTYRVPHRLGHVTLPPEGDRPVVVYLMPLPDGDPVGLHNTAALIWTIAADGEQDVAASLADLLADPVDTVLAEVEDFLAVLVAQRFLEEVR